MHFKMSTDPNLLEWDYVQIKRHFGLAEDEHPVLRYILPTLIFNTTLEVTIDRAGQLATQDNVSNIGTYVLRSNQTEPREIPYLGFHIRRSISWRHDAAVQVPITVIFHKVQGALQRDTRGLLGDQTKMIVNVPAGVPYHKMDDLRGPITMG